MSFDDWNVFSVISSNNPNKPDLKHKLHMVDMNYVNIWIGTN